MVVGQIGRRMFCAGLAGLGLHSKPAEAQGAWPNRPVRIVVATGPGVSNDLIARWLAERLAPRLGQPLVVENRTGASGVVAIEHVLQQPADGHTVFYANAGTFAVLPALDRRIRFDPLRDFIPVTHLGTAPLCLFVRDGMAARSIDEFVNLARANPGRLSVGTAGPGTASHMNFELIAKTAGIEALLVPFRTSSQAMPELAAGRLDAFIADLITAEPFRQAGQVRCLALTGTRRWPTLPEVPTFVERELPLSAAGWGGLFFKAGTSTEIAERLSAEVRTVLREPGAEERFLQFGHIITGSTPAELERLLREDMEYWRNAVRTTGATPE